MSQSDEPERTIEIGSQDLLERLAPEPPEDDWIIKVPPGSFEKMFEGLEVVYDHPEFEHVRFCLKAEVDVDLSEVFGSSNGALDEVNDGG